MTDPALLLADEPTGNLDSKTGEEVLRLFERLHAEGHTIVVVTHDPDIAARAQRRIALRDGVIESDEPTGTAPTAARPGGPGSSASWPAPAGRPA